LKEQEELKKRNLEDENVLTNASVISFAGQSKASYTSMAYKNVLTKPSLYSTSYILYPYSTLVPQSTGDITYQDGSIITLPNTTLPVLGTTSYFEYLTSNGDIHFGKAKPLYDINVASLSFEVSMEGISTELFYETTTYCSVLSTKYSNCIRGSDFQETISDT